MDITRGMFGVDGGFMYAGIELFGDLKAFGDGSFSDDELSDQHDWSEDFGEGTHYRVHIANNPLGTGGLMLSTDASHDFRDAFDPEDMAAYLDVDQELHLGNDYDLEIIDDGEVKVGSDDTAVLFGRLSTSDVGRPLVEIAFNYELYNEIIGDEYPDFLIDGSLALDSPLFLNFEASRGLTSNYNWNPHYTFNEAGTPYDPNNQPQNIYELDTLKGVAVIPAPAAAGAGLLLLGGMLMRRTTARRERT